MRFAAHLALGVTLAVSGVVCAFAFRGLQRLAGEDLPWFGPE